jgi:hypothetical protein
MRTWCCFCLLLAGIVASRWCPAQPPRDDLIDKEKAEQETNEDVEVLRQLMTEAVQGLYRWPQERLVKHCASCHDVEGLRAIEARPMDQFHFGATLDPHVLADHHKVFTKASVSSLANYVPGQGIIIQLEAPPPVINPDIKAWLTADSSEPSRWDVVLRGLRGEPEKNPPLWPQLLAQEYRRVHRLELTEKVVDVLIENGRNLRHLAADERVTVAFTFRAREKGSKESARAALLRHYDTPLRDSAPAPTAAGTTSVAGDLHLRQGHFAEAIAAYEEALSKAGVNVREPHKGPIPPNAIGLVKALIQAHVGAGSDENWSHAKMLHEWVKRSQTSRDDELTFLRRVHLDITGTLPAPAETKAFLDDKRPNRRELLLDRLLSGIDEDDGQSPLPSRMVVSCSKKQLDEVAGGKMSKTDFAGKITLRYYKPSAPKSKEKKSPHKQ